MEKITLSVITPTFNETDNINQLFKRMLKVLDSIGVSWEWLIIDDHSEDDTFDKIKTLASENDNIKGIRLSCNSGTHNASFCGLQLSKGECSIILASDLQDPPELIPKILDEWHEGAHIVWAARRKREGESLFKRISSLLYYWLMEKFVGIPNASPLGADFFLLDKKVQKAVNEYAEANVSILALIAKLGFVQKTIFYDKNQRLHGNLDGQLKKE